MAKLTLDENLMIGLFPAIRGLNPGALELMIHGLAIEFFGDLKQGKFTIGGEYVSLFARYDDLDMRGYSDFRVICKLDVDGGQTAIDLFREYLASRTYDDLMKCGCEVLRSNKSNHICIDVRRPFEQSAFMQNQAV